MHDGNTAVNEAQHVKYISSWEWRSAYILNNKFSLIRGPREVCLGAVILSCPCQLHHRLLSPVMPTLTPTQPFTENRTVLTFWGSRHVLVLDSCPQSYPPWPPPNPLAENRTVLTFWGSRQSPGISLLHPLSNHCRNGLRCRSLKNFQLTVFHRCANCSKFAGDNSDNVRCLFHSQ